MEVKKTKSGLLSNQESYQKVNNWVSLIIFAVVFGIFYSTMAPTVSFWDCGEYIASSYTLGIPHPPGNPLYVLIAHIFTMIFFWTKQVAFRVNLFSVFSGALTATVMFKIITRSLKGFIGEVDETWKGVTYIVSGVVGAAFSVFNYTVWFSSVEASVYIPALLMVVINTYIALIWAQSKDENRDKWLLLFAYLVFLGIGIHMMAMFALFPVFLFIILVDKSKLKNWRLWGVALLMGSVIYSMGAFIFIAPFLLIMTAVYAFAPRAVSAPLNAILPPILYMLVKANVNIEEGDTFPFILLEIIALVEAVVYYSNKAKEEQQPHIWQFVFGIVFMSVLGYSVHAYIPIRSALEPMIDENHPVITFTGSSATVAARDNFYKSLTTVKGQVWKDYANYLRAVKADSTLNAINDSLFNAVSIGEYSKPIFDDLQKEVSKRSDVKAKYDTFLTTLKEPQYRSTAGYYKLYLSEMKKRKIEWSAFRGFLERKQYGSESMITRMFHRRGAWSTQFGIDGHMGYGGFHLTQYYHFGEDINVDRKGSGHDGRGSYQRNNILSGPLSIKFEASLFRKSLSGEEATELSKMMGISSLDSLSDDEIIVAADNLKAEQKSMKGIQKFYSTRNFLRFIKRVLVLFIYLIPTILILMSWKTWVKRDWKVATLLITLVVTTSIGLVFYMNFADGTKIDGPEYRQWLQQKSVALAKGYQVPPKPRPVHREVRIRDYFWTTGFAFWGMWLGLALAVLLRFLYTLPEGDIKRKWANSVALLALFTPLIPISQNYEENNRTKDWIPYDYAYNLLQSCEKDGILFTNGDNDTFPLWFLQEAEGIRRDVRIINLSLVNTKWYIKQLKRLEPKVALDMSESDIDLKLHHKLNDVKVKAPYMLPHAKIQVVRPTVNEKRILRIQDQMVLDVVDANAWKKPIYFSVTVSPDNLMGLDPYLRQEGMVYRVMDHVVPRDSSMNFERSAYLLDKVYNFRNLGDGSTPLSETARKLMNNYAAAFIQYNLSQSAIHLNRYKREIDSLGTVLNANSDTTVNDSVVVDSTAIIAQIDSISQRKTSLVDEIINKYDRCVDIMPWDVRARKYREDFLIQQGKYELAMQRAKEALQIDPVNGLYRQWEANLERLVPAQESTSTETN